MLFLAIFIAPSSASFKAYILTGSVVAKFWIFTVKVKTDNIQALQMDFRDKNRQKGQKHRLFCEATWNKITAKEKPCKP